MPNDISHYTLGRGSLFFEAFLPGTQTPSGGERFIGDCNQIQFTFKTTDLDHFQSTSGVKELDFSIPLQVDRSGGFTTEIISPENMAFFFLGSSAVLATVGGAVVAEHHDAVNKDRYVQLGQTAANPSGARALDSGVPILVKNDAGSPVTYVITTDYTVDFVTGRVYIVPTGTIANGTNLRIGYTTLSQTRDQTISGSTPVEGKLRFVAANPTDVNRDMVIPWARFSPNGAFDLIGDKLQALQFDLKILKKGGTGGEAVYIDGRGIV